MTMAELIAYSRAISDGDGHTSLRDFDIDAKIRQPPEQALPAFVTTWEITGKLLTKIKDIKLKRASTRYKNIWNLEYMKRFASFLTISHHVKVHSCLHKRNCS